MTERNTTIDFLKGLAILAVLLVHTAQKYHLLPSVKYVCSFGQYGCSMFFVISGYLAYKSLKDRTLDFYKRRLLSIVPGYWLTIAFFMLFTFVWASLGLSPQYRQCRSFNGIAANALLLHGFLPFCMNTVVPGGWYIGTLVVLYALTPLLKQSLKNKKPIVWGLFLVSLVLVNIVFQFTITKMLKMTELSGNNHFLYFFFLNQLPCYLIGLYIADKDKEKDGRGNHFPNVWVGLLLILCAFSLTLFDWILSTMLLPPFVGLACGFILYGSLQKQLDVSSKNGMSSIIYQRISSYGAVSYSAYLPYRVCLLFYSYCQ